MAEIFIPKDVVTGFETLLKLSKKHLDQITKFLMDAKVSIDPNIFLSELETFIRINLKIKESKEIVQAIGSFVDLGKDEDADKVSENLATSYKEIHAKNISDKDFESLKNNLKQIFKSSENLEMSIKAYRLIRENNNVYNRSKIISDIRMVFDKDFSSKKKKAVLIHNLHITYKQNSQNKDFFVSLDFEDLKLFQEQIERALKKDSIIKTECKDFELL